MYPTYLDVIDLEVIFFRDIISNIKNMDFQPGPLPLIFRKFNEIDIKTPKGPSKNDHSEQPLKKSPEKSKDPKFKINPR